MDYKEALAILKKAQDDLAAGKKPDAREEAQVKEAFEYGLQNYSFFSGFFFPFSDLLKTKPYGEALLEKSFRAAAEIEPYIFFKNIKFIEDKLYKAELTEKAFRSAAIQEHPKIIFGYFSLLKNQSYKDEIFQIMASSEKPAKAIVHIFNQQHNFPSDKRFEYLKYFNASQEFDLITNGREETFTSTYNGIVNDLLEKLAFPQKFTITDILSPEQMPRMGIFLEAAASYNRMGDVLKFIPQDKLPAIIRDIVARAGNDKDYRYLATTANLLMSLKDNESMCQILEKEIARQYKNTKGNDGFNEAQDRFGVLISLYCNNIKDPKIPDEIKPLFLEIAANDRYKISIANGMDKNQITNKMGVCNQLMVFADDEDSKNSFAHWKQTYAGQPGWTIEEKETYTHIYSTDGKIPVHIYANNPDRYSDGLRDIKGEVSEFKVFIGRGHSFHADQYIQLIDKNMELVHLGSCGGYNNVSKVLQKSPYAQIIATKATGSMFVNDPLLFEINQSFRKNGSVSWKEQQINLDKMASQYKESYLLPNINIDAEMQKKCNKLKITSDIPSIQTESHERSGAMLKYSFTAAALFENTTLTPATISRTNNGDISGLAGKVNSKLFALEGKTKAVFNSLAVNPPGKPEDKDIVTAPLQKPLFTA